MYFGLTEEQELLQHTVRNFTEGALGPQRPRDLFESGVGHISPQVRALREAPRRSGMSDNHESFERFFPAMLRGDRETLRELFTDDIAWHLPPFSRSRGVSEETKGREQVVKFLCDMGATLYEPGSFQLQPEVQAVEGDQAVMFCWLSARTAKGADYRNLYAFALRFRDGRICGGWELLDSAHWVAQCG